jgi:hypothetical protein
MTDEHCDQVVASLKAAMRRRDLSSEDRQWQAGMWLAFCRLTTLIAKSTDDDDLLRRLDAALAELPEEVE